jgi:chromosome segregation ATPase
LEQTIEKAGESLKSLEERESESTDREQTQVEKLSFLEGQFKEASIRAEAAQRNVGVLERNILEATNEIATWKTKTAEIEQEMEDMDNMADSPEADVTSTLATSAERRQSMAADLKETNKKKEEEAKKPPPFTPPVKVRDDSESEVEDAEPEAQESEPEAQESEPEAQESEPEEDDDGPDLFKKDSPPTIRRQTRDITPEESEEEDSEEEEESEEESD